MQSSQVQPPTESVLYLSRLALHKQINAIVLFFKNLVEVILEA